jgi:uncharacterized protein (DUF302 family)
MGTIGFTAGLVAGVLFALCVGVVLARSRMIVVHKSPYPLEETVGRLEAAIRGAGWMLADSKRLNDSLERNEVFFGPRVHLLKLCEPHHASTVLADAREMACLMPCTFAVYDGDKGETLVSHINTSLMARIFGGTVWRVMGGPVSRAEHAMLRGALQKDRPVPEADPV